MMGYKFCRTSWHYRNGHRPAVPEAFLRVEVPWAVFLHFADLYLLLAKGSCWLIVPRSSKVLRLAQPVWCWPIFWHVGLWWGQHFPANMVFCEKFFEGLAFHVFRRDYNDTDDDFDNVGSYCSSLIACMCLHLKPGQEAGSEEKLVEGYESRMDFLMTLHMIQNYGKAESLCSI